MRLHSLQMHAFGPFAVATSVDFDALGCDGLFLLHGQTGAGKTTVLDAVAFALFGRVPGARDQDRLLLSDHAAVGEIPSVVLEATIGGRRMRVTRSPEHRRAKKRGEGLTAVAASGTLVWVDGSGPPLSRLNEIGEVVTRILGMSAEQFFQVVLLPQGDFARFLRAATDDREKLLERLFETDRFNDLEAWLRDRARTMRAAREEKEQAVDRIAAQIAGLVGDEQPTENDTAWAQGHLDAARADDVEATSVFEAARTASENADSALTTGTRIAELRRRAAAARARLDALDASRDVLDGARDALDAARRAEPIRPLVRERDEARAGALRAASALDAATRAMADDAEGVALLAELDAAPADADGTTIDAAIDRWSAESGRLEPIAQRAATRPEIVARIGELDTRVRGASVSAAALERDIAAIPEATALAVGDLTDSQAMRVRLPQVQQEMAVASAVRAAAARLPALQTALAQARDAVSSSRERHLETRERQLALHDRRIAGMAAELAGRLRDGDRCAVCGAVEHPAPATAVEHGVTEAEQIEADYAEKRAADRRAVADEKFAAAQREHDVVSAAAAGVSITDADASVELLTVELAAVTAGAERVEACQRTVDELADRGGVLRDRLAAERAAQARHEEQLSTWRSRLAELDAEVVEATGGSGTVAGRRSVLGARCRMAAALRDARVAAISATRRMTDIEDTLVSLSAEAGFDDVDAAVAAFADSATVTGWDEQIARASALRAAAAATLADPEIVAASTEPAPDVDALSRARTDCAEAFTAAAQRHSRAGDRFARLQDLGAAYWSALSVLQPAVDRDREVQGLADLVAGRGQNSRQMSLRSYVLAARLEEVLVAASTRLREMSSGRYEFAHTDAAASRGRRSGLGIEVRDEYTGAVRPAATLSGGETFFASLALALGLADVVSAESGGRVLDTMFIDEGFGTLDPEALDLVMRVLDDLRSGGRVVGVVSHVEEMKARIPAQLQVIRAEGGSTLAMVGAVAV